MVFQTVQGGINGTTQTTAHRFGVHFISRYIRIAKRNATLSKLKKNTVEAL